MSKKDSLERIAAALEGIQAQIRTANAISMGQYTSDKLIGDSNNDDARRVAEATSNLAARLFTDNVLAGYQPEERQAEQPAEEEAPEPEHD